MFRVGVSAIDNELVITEIKDSKYMLSWVSPTFLNKKYIGSLWVSHNEVLTMYTAYKVTNLGTYKTQEEAFNDFPEYFL
jgi:hypothetical protein